ncbi:MAG: hypothetical protein KJ674_03540 [Nanoarchaeota archaeon]|nr:hypothetical protein [Nanoarchaeota archaeon]
MNEDLKKSILDVLKESLDAIKVNDINKLKDLSNRLIHNSSIMQDEDSIIMNVLIYSLSKVFERTNYRQFKDWNLFVKNCIDNMKKAHFSLLNNDFVNYRKNIKEILIIIDKLDSKLKLYIKNVFHNAHIARGSRLYEHGISVGRTAELLGLNQFELMDYIGKTGIADIKEGFTLDVVKRLNIARSLFK